MIDTHLAAIREAAVRIAQSNWIPARRDGDAILRALDEAEKDGAALALRDQYPGLQTVYTTPDVCGHCAEHLSRDWEYCPGCGRRIERGSRMSETITTVEVRKLIEGIRGLGPHLTSDEAGRIGSVLYEAACRLEKEAPND